MRTNNFKYVFATISAAAIFSVSLNSSAESVENYPSKPMNYIIPFSAGGESDLAARFQQASFEKVAGVPAIIQYMAGAGGAAAWSQLNRMPGDGYTVMGINIPHTILQPLQKDVGYQTDDLTPVNYDHYTPDAIFVLADSQFETLNDLIDYAKKNPAMVTFSGSGSYSSNNIAQVRLDELAGVTTTYIPYNGTGPAITAVLGNQVVAGFNYASSGSNYGDKLRMLAIAAEERLPAYPEVPTFRELGIELVGGAYRGVAVPSSTPEKIKQKVSDIFSEISTDPEHKNRMEANGFVITNITYDKMDEFITARKKEYTAVAEKLGIVTQQ